jgi:hypothetical protein
MLFLLTHPTLSGLGVPVDPLPVQRLIGTVRYMAVPEFTHLLADNNLLS